MKKVSFLDMIVFAKRSYKKGNLPMQCKQNKAQEQIKKLKNHLGHAQNGNLLTSLFNLDCCQQVINNYPPIRERVYSPFRVICSFIKQVLNSDKSCSNAVISIAAERIKKGKTLSINTGPYVKARQRLPKEIVYDLVRTVGKESLKTAASSWKLFGREVKLCDGTNVQMPDTKTNNKEFPKHNNKKKVTPQVRHPECVFLREGSPFR
jgi:hypothetical protein